MSFESCSVISRKPPTKFEGAIKKNRETGEEYIAFLGIPYAEKPLGSKRFQAPESLISEPNADLRIPVYKANVTDKICTRIHKGRVEGTADCLYMNIFLPKRPELIDSPLPVLVFIHGGGFTSGSNDHEHTTPDTIIQHDLIFITINYRLGLYGFLNWHTENCPGNAGLKDQRKALEWIQNNIDCFRGDPNNVTISGSGAGATCVNFLLIDPGSKDLFHKAIVQSGGIYSLMGYRGHRREQKSILSKDAGIERWLFTEDTERLHRRAIEVIERDRASRHPLSFAPYFGPSVESFREGAIIPDVVEEMVTKVDHDKPVMAGIAREEGIYFLMGRNQEEILRWIHNAQHFRQFLMDCLRWSSQTAENVADDIRRKYFPDRLYMSPLDKHRKFAKLLHDICFRRFYENFRFGPDKAVHKNLYVYEFDHYSEISLANRDTSSGINVATHSDELRYMYCPVHVRRIFKKYIGESADQNPNIQRVMKHTCSLWANFCKTGVPKSDLEPNVEWRRHTAEKPCYLNISKDLVLREESLCEDRWEWLNNIVDAQPTVESLPPSPK